MREKITAHQDVPISYVATNAWIGFLSILVGGEKKLETKKKKKNNPE